MPSFVRALVGIGSCVAGVAGFAPVPAGARGLHLRMQMAMPAPPQPVAVPALQVGSSATVAEGMMSRYEERLGLYGNMLIANHGGEGHGGLDVPYKLMKLKDNKNLHMSEEEKMEWEKKLTGKEVEEGTKFDTLKGVASLVAIWTPLLYATQYVNKDLSSRNEKRAAAAYLVLLLCVPFNILLSGTVYPDAEWEKVQEVLTWLLVWSPAIAIWSLSKVLDGLREESINKELTTRVRD